LQSLSNNLSLAQPFIGRITQETNLTGFFQFLKMPNVNDKNQVVPVDLTSLIDKVALALHKRSMVKCFALLESLISDKKTHSGNGFIIVSPKFDYAHIRPPKVRLSLSASRC